MPTSLPFTKRLLRLPAALLSAADHLWGTRPILFGPGFETITGPRG